MMKFCGALIAACGFGLCLFLVIFLTNDIRAIPEPREIDLSKLPGRILSADNTAGASAHSFKIERDFNEVSGWGDETIISYRKLLGKRKIAILAWKPDKQTLGAIDVAEKEISLEEMLLFHEVSSVEIKEKTLLLHFGVDKNKASVAIVVSILGLMVVAIGLRIYVV